MLTPEQKAAIDAIAAKIEENPRLREAVKQAQHEERMRRLGRVGVSFRKIDETWVWRFRGEAWSAGASTVEFAALEAEQAAKERGLLS